MQIKTELEEDIEDIFNQLHKFEDKSSIEYKNLIQRIYSPIWKWALLCFDEEKIKNSGTEIFQCVKRTIVNYDSSFEISYIGYLYGSLEKEIHYKNCFDKNSEFKMCSNKDYENAKNLIKTAERVGKNPYSKNVQIWLAKQFSFSLEKVKNLVEKYYQSQIVEEYKTDLDDENSIFETAQIQNNFPKPDVEFFNLESAKDDLQIIEETFESCQNRQKIYLSSFITLKIIQTLEKHFLVSQINDLLKNRNFKDIEILVNFIEKSELPTQKDLCIKFDKDEGYISNRISEFFEKVKNKMSTL